MSDYAAPSNSPIAATSGRAETTWFGHPPGLFLLFGVEMWERFSFYGMKAILVLYLVTKITEQNAGRGWPDGASTILAGWYGGMCYLLPLLGGVIADKLLGTHRSMMTGGLIIAAGHVVLAISGIGEYAHNDMGMTIFIFGLALIALGTGHFKPSVTVMVGQLYAPDDARRSNAFGIFYMGINVGATLGQTVVGYLGEKVNWHYGFGAAAIGMLAGIGMYIAARPTYLRGTGDPPAGRRNYSLLCAIIIFAVAGLFAWSYHIGQLAAVNTSLTELMADKWRATIITSTVLLVILVASLWFIMIQHPGDKGPTACILIFMVFNAFFWLAFEQSDKSLTLFALNHTDRFVGSWEMPASWLQNVNPLSIVLLTPIFGAMWIQFATRNATPSQPVKIAIGLIVIGLGYLFMVGAGSIAAGGSKAGLIWLIVTYVIFTIGELWLSPTGLAFVTKTAPVRFVSFLMGIWLLSSFVAHTAGGYVAALTEKFETGEWFVLPVKFGGQADFFALFVVMCVGAGVLALVLTPAFKTMMRDPND